MVAVKSVGVRNGQFEFGGASIDGNVVSVITGPNGAGKTDILCAIAENIRSDSYFPNGISGVVSRLICQTFSPFSRFSEGHGREGGVASSYRDGLDDLSFYISLGITKSKPFRSSRVAVEVLERAILGVSQSEERANHFFRFLSAVGFLERCAINFRFYPAASRFLKAMRRGERFAQEVVRSGEGKRALSELRRQIDLDGWREVFEVIDVSLSTIGESSREVLVDFGRDAVGSSLAFARFQALSVLRRLKMVDVNEVRVFRKSGEALGITSTSSGEQQFLCSMLGLAGTVRNESIILIDEPELSLHPRWQIDYAGHLMELLKLVGGCHVLIATHSPLITQGFLNHGCEVISLRAKGGGQSINRMAKSVEGVLVDVFDSPVPSSLYLADELMRIISLDQESGCSKEDALDRLNALEHTFLESPEDIKLIRDAKRLVSDDE